MIALVAASTASAQPGPGGHGGGPMADRMPMMGMMMGGGHCAMLRRTEGALAFLKTELKIAAAQEKAWEGFAAAFRQEAANKAKNAKAHGHGPKMGPGAKPDAAEPFPQAMARHIEMMDQHHAGAKKLSDAAKPLYDALNAEQRKTADELLMHFVMSHCGM
jgi:hypothetical protein